MCFATPEEKAAVAASLNLAADASDADVTAALVKDRMTVAQEAVAAQQLAEEAGTQVAALSVQLKDKEAEVVRLSATLEQKVLALSAAGTRQHSPEDVADYLETVTELREQAIAAGAVSEAKAGMVDALLTDAAGNPTALALSAVGTGQDRRRLGVKLWKTIKQLKGDDAVATGTAVTRLSAAAAPEFKTPDYSGNKPAELSPDELRRRVDANLAQTELGRRALAARKAATV